MLTLNMGTSGGKVIINNDLVIILRKNIDKPGWSLVFDGSKEKYAIQRDRTGRVTVNENL